MEFYVKRGPGDLSRVSKRQRKNNNPKQSKPAVEYLHTPGQVEWWNHLPSFEEGMEVDRNASNSGSDETLLCATSPFELDLDHLELCVSVFNDLELFRGNNFGPQETDIEAAPESREAAVQEDRRAQSNSLQAISHVSHVATVLFIDICSFSTLSANMSAGEVAIWVNDFYARVDEVSAKWGVCKVEVRGDCCICVCGDVPASLKLEGQGTNQVGRMLEFAAELHQNLEQSSTITRTRMGLATGEVAFLLDDTHRFAFVHGNIVNLAARMEALARPGTVVVHQLSLNLWSEETGRPCPQTQLHSCKGLGLQPAAMYNLGLSSFDANEPVEPVERSRSGPRLRSFSM